MKQFINNNLKVIIAVIISGIIFGSIGVFAASSYFARDITFTPTNESFKKENGEVIDNVEDAINELYNNSNKPLILKIRTESYGSTRQGVTNYNLGETDIISKYKYFKFKLLSASAVKSWEMYGYNTTTNSIVKLNPDIEYSFENYNSIWTVVYSQFDGNMGYVVLETEFYN